MPAAYAELHCRSNFSFLTGASHPEELVQRAHALGYAALAITDECSLAGVVRAHLEAKRVGLHLIVGALMRLSAPQAGASHTADASQHKVAALHAEASPQAVPSLHPAASPQALASRQASTQPDDLAHAGPHLVLLAQSRRGYGNLSHWITLARRRAAKGAYRAHAADLEGKAPSAPTLAGLPGCAALLVPHPLQPFETVFAHAMWLKTWFGPERAFIALERLLGPHDDWLHDTVARVTQATGLAMVAAGNVLMHARSRKPLQDVLTATRLRQPVAACGHGLEPNAEAHLRSRARLTALYPPEALAATVALAGQCAFSLDELRYEYPQEIVPAGHTPTSWLRVLTEEGAQRRFPGGVPPSVRATLEHELALIAQLK